MCVFCMCVCFSYVCISFVQGYVCECMSAHVCMCVCGGVCVCVCVCARVCVCVHVFLWVSVLVFFSHNIPALHCATQTTQYWSGWWLQLEVLSLITFFRNWKHVCHAWSTNKALPIFWLGKKIAFFCGIHTSQDRSGLNIQQEHKSWAHEQLMFVKALLI